MVELLYMVELLQNIQSKEQNVEQKILFKNENVIKQQKENLKPGLPICITRVTCAKLHRNVMVEQETFLMKYTFYSFKLYTNYLSFE